jgi:hypothetical protein
MDFSAIKTVRVVLGWQLIMTIVVIDPLLILPISISCRSSKDTTIMKNMKTTRTTVTLTRVIIVQQFLHLFHPLRRLRQRKFLCITELITAALLSLMASTWEIYQKTTRLLDRLPFRQLPEHKHKTIQQRWKDSAPFSPNSSAIQYAELEWPERNSRRLNECSQALVDL